MATSLALVMVVAAGWCGLWYYAASVADRALNGWVTREAAAGRDYSCGSQNISGFPFRIVAHCGAATAALRANRPPFAATATDVTFTAQVWHPTALVGDITGPLALAEPGEPPSYAATWSLARIRVSGLPPYPDSLSVRIEQAHLDHLTASAPAVLLAADHAELQGSIIGGAANSNPVIEAVLQFASATAPTLHPLLAEPLQGHVDAVLRGFQDLSPKPWAERFREMHAAGGNIEIKSLRIERADAIIVGNGTLTVNSQGRLEGLISVAIVGVDHLVPLLGVDRLIGHGIDRLNGSSGQPTGGLAALDRLLPGLGGVVRDSANASIIESLKKMGQPTEIDHKPAIVLPLRFSDGAVYLGMLPLGAVPALF
jgi:hypothetical protein